jgi:SAM-dependent methyltransferase
MGLNAAHGHPPAPRQGGHEPEEVIWHDLECGGYRADLALWAELARQAEPRPGAGAILDVGAGSGRVALDLARRGHRVTAVDISPALLEALRAHAEDLPVQTVCADARDLSLPREDYALCLVPMQTLQLLGGASGRVRFLARARAHLAPGGLVASAIVTDIDPFDCRAGDSAPSAEVVELDGRRYESRAMFVGVQDEQIVIGRERTISPAGRSGWIASPELNVIRLDRLDAAMLEREALRAGLDAVGIREIPPTADHVGSLVVLLGA